MLRVLAEAGAPDVVVFHSFSGDAELAKKCADAGYYMSFSGPVTYKNAAYLREAAKVAPKELILVETDAPYLPPTPHRGKPNSPYLIPLTLRCLAEVKSMPEDELCAAISANGEQVFGAWWFPPRRRFSPVRRGRAVPAVAGGPEREAGNRLPAFPHGGEGQAWPMSRCALR